MGKTIDQILADFTPVHSEPDGTLKGGRPVTIWLPLEAKTRYDRLQEKSGRKFSAKAREVLLELIEAAETLRK